MEVLDEPSGEILRLLFPLCRISVGVAWIEDMGVDSLQLRRNYEVEVRDGLGRDGVDAVVEDGVDDSTGVADGDALSGSVPAGVYEVCLCAALLHLLYELLSVLGRMKLEEGLAEAGGEGRGRLGDSALCSGKFGGEAGEEVVLGLLGVKDGYRRKNSECVCGEEDDLLCRRALRVWTDDVLDVVDRVGNTGVLGNALVVEIDLAVLVYGYVLEEGVAADGVVDVWLSVLVELDDLGIAAAFEVEDALVVPAVLVVTDELTLRVGGKGGLAGSGETEEDSGVLAVHVGVGGAVHGCDALEWKEVVHHGEHTLLHLAAVPGVEDDLLFGGYVEEDCGLGAEAELLVVLNLGLGCVVYNEIWLLVHLGLVLRTDEHVGDEMCLPCDFHDETDLHAGVLVGSAESVDNVELLAGELLLGELLAGVPCLDGCLVVVVRIFLGGPPNRTWCTFLGGVVVDDELVFRGAAGIDAGHNVEGSEFSLLSLVVSGQAWLGLLVEENLVRWVVKYFLYVFDPILA